MPARPRPRRAQPSRDPSAHVGHSLQRIVPDGIDRTADAAQHRL